MSGQTGKPRSPTIVLAATGRYDAIRVGEAGMKRCVMSVRAVPGGWVVSADRLLAPLMFRSGAHAEREAYRLGKALVRAGCEVELSVHDRQDALVAQISLADARLEPAQPKPRPWQRFGDEPTALPMAPIWRGAGRLSLVAAAGFGRA